MGQMNMTAIRLPVPKLWAAAVTQRFGFDRDGRPVRSRILQLDDQHIKEKVLATRAVNSLVIQLAKITGYWTFGVLSLDIV